MKRLTKQEFVERSLAVHQKTYDYSLVEYINGGIKVKIICNAHGIFEQTPYGHLRGNGCPRCASQVSGQNRSLTSKQFIEKSVGRHGTKYDYSLVEYINYNTKVKIICPIHGEFLQTPDGHLANGGCKKCGSKIAGQRRLSTTKKFIEQAISKHGRTYDYSLVEYTTARTKIKIICPLHGEFYQAPFSHLSGYGCMYCSPTIKKNTDQFVKQAQLVHRYFYDYSLVEYINYNTKVKIICPIHGEFEQLPHNHLSNHGCSKCNVIGGYSLEFFEHWPEYKNKPSLLYLLQFNFENESFLKIGITTRMLQQRFNNIWFKEILVYTMPLYYAFKLEQNTIRKFHSYRYYPLSLVNGKTECFNISVKQDIINYMLINQTSPT